MISNAHARAIIREPAKGLTLRGRNLVVAAGVVAIVAAMGALAAYSAPLYRLFCQATGFDGSTKVAAAAPGAVALSSIAVGFDTNVAPGLPWRFTPPKAITTKLGEEQRIVFEVTNLGDAPTLGTATFNVTPLSAGKYFDKIQCFCFTEQALMPGETRPLPVTFFIDPGIAGDSDMRDIHAITLSYTFFSKGQASLERYLRTHAISTSQSGEAER